MSVNCVTTFTLPHGLWIDGCRHQDVELRSLSGDDEIVLFDSNVMLPLPAWVTLVLVRFVRQVGSVNPVSEDLIRSMTIGDREALLLNLVQILSGDRFDCIVKCSDPDCGQQMDLELYISELVVNPISEVHETYTDQFQDDDNLYEVCYRLPTGADQEMLVRLALQGENVTSRELVKNCVQRILKNGSQIENVPASIVDLLSQAMLKRDPQSEIQFDLQCAWCDKPVSIIFDTAGFLRKIVAQQSQHLYQQVHELAFHYHWSESEILAMPTATRQRYLNILDQTLSGGSHWS